MRTLLFCVSALLLALAPSRLNAQSSAPAAGVAARSTDAYVLEREVTLLGTVAAYSYPDSSLPYASHLVLRTSTGLVDIDLGDPRFLAANQFVIHLGNSLRIIGETVDVHGSSHFLARIVQHGTTALAVRSPRGFPLTPASPARHEGAL